MTSVPVCELCHKSFSTKSNLNRHLSKKICNSTLNCECGKSFKYLKSYESHKTICAIHQKINAERESQIFQANDSKIDELMKTVSTIADTLATLKNTPVINNITNHNTTNNMTNLFVKNARINNYYLTVPLEDVLETIGDSLQIEHTENIDTLKSFTADKLKQSVKCTDVARQNYKVLNKDRKIEKDPHGRKTATRVFTALRPRVEEILSEEHAQNNKELNRINELIELQRSRSKLANTKSMEGKAKLICNRLDTIIDTRARVEGISEGIPSEIYQYHKSVAPLLINPEKATIESEN